TIGAALEHIAARLERPALEAGEPLQHILRPADRLAELAVADHIYAGVGLRLHHVDDRLREALVVGLLVEALALLPCAQELLQLRWPDQASDMGGEDALGAAFHESGHRFGCALVTAGQGRNNPWAWPTCCRCNCKPGGPALPLSRATCCFKSATHAQRLRDRPYGPRRRYARRLHHVRQMLRGLPDHGCRRRRRYRSAGGDRGRARYRPHRRWARGFAQMGERLRALR